jgi:hypothetical protein
MPRPRLGIDVRESIEFYRQIEGWAAAALGTVCR